MNKKEVVEYLLAKGYPRHIAAAFTGNIGQESDYNPLAFNDKEDAFGLVQWRGTRLAALREFVAASGMDYKDWRAQLDFLDHELNTTERAAREKIFSAPDVDTATAAVDRYYERSAGLHTDKRIAKARQAAGLIEPNLLELPTTTEWASSPEQLAGDPSNATDLGQDPMLIDLASGVQMPEQQRKPIISEIDIGAGLAALGQGLSQLGALEPVDLSNVRREYYARREREEEQETRRQAIAKASQVFKNLPGGAPFADMLTEGMDPELVFSLYNASEGRDLTRSEGSLDRAAAAAEAEAGRLFTLKRDESSQSFTREGWERDEAFRRGLLKAEQDFVASESAAGRQHDLTRDRERYAFDFNAAELDRAFTLGRDEADRTFRKAESTEERDFRRAIFDDELEVDKDRLLLQREEIAQSAAQAKLQFGLDAYKTTSDLTRLNRLADLEERRYNEAVKVGEDTGEAGKEFIARMFDGLGDDSSAAAVRAMPDTAFSDPAAVANFRQSISDLYTKDKGESTSAMQNFFALQQLEAQDAANAAAGNPTNYAEQFKALISKPDTTVNVGETAEVARAKAQVSRDTASLDNSLKALGPARAAKASIQQMQATMEANPDMATGAVVGSVFQPMLRIASDLGLISGSDAEKATQDREFFQAIANRIFPTFREEGSGSVSDFESRNMQMAFANIGMSEQANKDVLRYYATLADRAVIYHNLKQAWYDQNGSLKGFEADYQKKLDSGDASVGPMIVYDTAQFSDDALKGHIDRGHLKAGDPIYVTVDGKKTLVPLTESLISVIME